VTFETRAQARDWCREHFHGSPIREVGAGGREKGSPSKAKNMEAPNDENNFTPEGLKRSERQGWSCPRWTSTTMPRRTISDNNATAKERGD
jgi:hypothetical protein